MAMLLEAPKGNSSGSSLAGNEHTSAMFSAMEFLTEHLTEAGAAKFEAEMAASVDMPGIHPMDVIDRWFISVCIAGDEDALAKIEAAIALAA